MFRVRLLPRPRHVRVGLAVVLAAVAALLAQGQPPATPALAQSAPLPPLPARWPTGLQLGMADSPGGAGAMRATTSYGFRYQYLSGGANTGNGWANWNQNGAFATYYIQDSVQNNIIPTFTYYQLLQSTPGSSGGESAAVYANLQNRATMTAYYNDLKLLFQRAGAFPNNTVVVHVEPDAWGHMERRAANNDAATVAAQVQATGLADLAGLPDDTSGFARAIVRLRDKYAPNVVLGYHLSIWGTGSDLIYSKPDNATVQALARQAGNYYLSLKANFDVVFAEFGDRDAAFKQFQYNDGGASWWAPADFARNQLFIGTFVSTAQRRVVFWQIPQGNTRMRAMNNTWNHYQDNHVEWLLDDSSRNNLNGYVQNGVIGFLFGRGANGATCACDANGDGVTNPTAINGNNQTSYNADDDGGFFRNRSTAYYAAGVMPLPRGGGSAPPTPTPIPSAPTNTPTPTSGVSQTLTFDELPNPNRALTGQYPTGVADWGTSAWYLSGPYGKFATPSISFRSAGPTSATVMLMGSRQLVSVQAYNGGGAPSQVTLSCAGQPTRTFTLAAQQLSTLTTGWTGTCATLTIGSSNSWDTNFDSLVVR